MIGLFLAIGYYPEVEAAGFGELYLLEIVADAIVVAFVTFCAVLFFRKSRKAPAATIALWIGHFVILSIMMIVEKSERADVFCDESGKQLIRSVIGAVIWIPYFLVSKRVRQTFVNYTSPGQKCYVGVCSRIRQNAGEPTRILANAATSQTQYSPRAVQMTRGRESAIRSCRSARVQAGKSAIPR